MAQSIVNSIVAAFVFLTSLVGAFAANYTVGGDRGWIAPNSGLNYSVWAGNVTAYVGDHLYFKYNANAHNVLKVNSTVYAACDTKDFLEIWDTGDTTVTLQEVGTHYFMCGAPGHCGMGQAFSIDVGTAASDTTPGGSTAPAVLSPPGSSGSLVNRWLSFAVLNAVVVFFCSLP